MSKTQFTTSKLSFERLREVLNYDKETGVFTWKARPGTGGPRYLAKVAGSLNSLGYRSLRVDGVLHAEHRLALFWIAGKPSEAKQIDHINRDRSDNSFSNLREASQSQNKQNTGLQINNFSGFKGVSWSKRDKKWVAGIKINKNLIHLGSFKSFEDAVKARKAAEIIHHPFRVTAQ